MEKVKVISQIVDTLKTHYYISPEIQDEDYKKYLDLMAKLTSLKKEAQELSNNYGDTKSINLFLGAKKFNVNPTSIRGFSFLISNADCSIALRQTKSKVNSSPLIKVEFRAEYLARIGYKKALEVLNALISEFILATFTIKISEIHLACDLQGYEFKLLDMARIRTRSRKSSTYESETFEAVNSAYGGVTSFSGMTFGGGDYHLRVYDKTREISLKPNKGFVKHHVWHYSDSYNEDMRVWRVEIQIRRAKLKKLTLSDNTSLDTYENVLNAIPSLWKKALQDFNFKDLSDEKLFDVMRGYRKLKNGKDKPLTKYSIYKYYQRAETISFWDGMKLWNGFESDALNIAKKLPKIGSFLYVENSIKSLFSTMAKHYGDTSTLNFFDSFKRANENNLEKNGCSLLESVYIKQLDWINSVDELRASGVCDTPEYKNLEKEIYQAVSVVNNNIKETTFSSKIIEKIANRDLNCVGVTREHLTTEIDYLNNLIEKNEAMVLF